MTNGDLKAQRAVLWSRRFSLLYAMGVWTVIGYLVSQSVHFKEIPLEEKKEPPPQPPPAKFTGLKQSDLQETIYRVTNMPRLLFWVSFRYKDNGLEKE
uniref:Small integral membrane protein 26 n=1 Tax=Pseudonaja textilis TaxID=8673 RepID=A0A670Y7N4_PSETE